VFKGFNLFKDHFGTWLNASHKNFAFWSTQCTQKQESSWHCSKVGSLWDTDLTWCIFRLSFKVSHSQPFDLSTSPTFISQNNLLTCFPVDAYAAWYLLNSNLKN
jgi:hypothetical protein